jgi:hypothetical protein
MEFRFWLKLNETHYTDFYGRRFEEFRKKYSPYKKDNTLFVNFSNYSKDVLERTAYSDPNHKDPVGIYAYPLWYVINHPADIWYGSNARYLRVIKNVSPKVLYLQDMDERFADNLLWKLRKQGMDLGNLEDSQSHFKHEKGTGKVGKQFFQLLQHDFPNKTPEEELRLRSSIEQTDILKQLGIDVVVDNVTRKGKESQAVINDREPAQAIFLVPTAIKILEVFDLGQKEQNISTSRSYGDIVARKLVSLILAKLDDRIVERATDRPETSQEQVYYSAKGRMIQISFVLPDSYYNTRKMGQKIHKENELSDLYFPRIKMFGEKKDTIRSYGSKDKFSDIARDFANAYLKNEDNTDFKPFSFKRSQQEEEARKKEYYKKQAKEKNEQEWKDEKIAIPLLNDALKLIGSDVKLDFSKKWFHELKSFNYLVSPSETSKRTVPSDELIQDAWKTYKVLSQHGHGTLDENDPETQALISLYKQMLDMPNSDLRIFRTLNIQTIRSFIEHDSQKIIDKT